MMTCQLMGVNALCFFREESAYGTLPSGTWAQAPFMTCDIAATDPVDNSVVLGYGRAPQRPARNNIPVAGNLVIPLDTVWIGYWLKFLMGAPVTTTVGAGKQHLFQSGLDTLPSFSLCFRQNGGTTPIYFKYLGCVINTAALTIGNDGRPQVTLGIIGRQEIEDNVNPTGTPVVVAPVYYHNKMGVTNLNGVAVGRISSADMNISNNYETAYYVGGGGLIGCADPGMFAVTGTIQTRFNDSALATLAEAETVADYNFGWFMDTLRSVMFEYDQVDFLRAGNPISGPGARVRTFNLIGSQDVTEGDALRVTLLNSQGVY